MSRFVHPSTKTLTLANGDTLLVKCRLNAAEARVMKAMQEMPTLAEAGVVMAYLVTWSLVGLDGQPVLIEGVSPPDLASKIDALDEDDFAEIYAAIATHRDAMGAERDAQKKIRAGAPASETISPSPSAPASPLTPSEGSTSTSTTS